MLFDVEVRKERPIGWRVVEKRRASVRRTKGIRKKGQGIKNYVVK
jgi:hypothetical protein